MATKRRVRPALAANKRPGPEDLAAARELNEALRQVMELPEADRWSMALALLSDEHLLAAVQTQGEEATLNRLGSLAVAAVQGMYGLEPGSEAEGLDYAQLLTIAVYNVLVSYTAELEKRQQQFCRDVVHMEGPLKLDPEQPIQLIPKGSEAVTVRMLLDYYGAPRDSAPAASES